MRFRRQRGRSHFRTVPYLFVEIIRIQTGQKFGTTMRDSCVTAQWRPATSTASSYLSISAFYCFFGALSSSDVFLTSSPLQQHRIILWHEEHFAIPFGFSEKIRNEPHRMLSVSSSGVVLHLLPKRTMWKQRKLRRRDRVVAVLRR